MYVAPNCFWQIQGDAKAQRDARVTKETNPFEADATFMMTILVLYMNQIIRLQ